VSAVCPPQRRAGCPIRVPPVGQTRQSDADLSRGERGRGWCGTGARRRAAREGRAPANRRAFSCSRSLCSPTRGARPLHCSSLSLSSLTLITPFGPAAALMAGDGSPGRTPPPPVLEAKPRVVADASTVALAPPAPAWARPSREVARRRAAEERDIAERNGRDGKGGSPARAGERNRKAEAENGSGGDRPSLSTSACPST